MNALKMRLLIPFLRMTGIFEPNQRKDRLGAGRRPRNWWLKRKARMKMARASRRANR